MNKQDADRIQQICSLIAVEQNRRKFLTLVEELNAILAAKDESLLNRSPGREKLNKGKPG